MRDVGVFGPYGDHGDHTLYGAGTGRGRLHDRGETNQPPVRDFLWGIAVSREGFGKKLVGRCADVPGGSGDCHLITWAPVQKSVHPVCGRYQQLPRKLLGI